jgi:chromosome segregation ATPase
MNEREKKIYKSPKRKLLSFFEKSRDQWKSKCVQAKATVKRLNHRIRYLESSKAEWKNRAKELEKELARMKAKQSQEVDWEDDKKNR